MISIITAIYNQLEMNRLFWEYLVKYTDHPFELIVVDNNSDDGSREFFESLPGDVTVIRNEANYSYSHCQNQGLAIAKYDVLAFLNNDLLVSPHWDSRLTEVLGKDGFHVLSVGSNDRLEDKKTTRRLHNRWKRAKYPVMALFGKSRFSLRLMAWLTYGNWEKFCERNFEKYGFTTTDGFSGSAIIMNRRAIQLLGQWDSTRIEADYDLFYSSCQREEQRGDIRRISIVNGVFFHHYRRLTFYSKYPPYADRKNLYKIEGKWPKSDRVRWNRYVKFR